MQMLLVCPLWSDGQCERAVNTLSSVLLMVLFYRKFMLPEIYEGFHTAA